MKAEDLPFIESITPKGIKSIHRTAYSTISKLMKNTCAACVRIEIAPEHVALLVILTKYYDSNLNRVGSLFYVGLRNAIVDFDLDTMVVSISCAEEHLDVNNYITVPSQTFLKNLGENIARKITVKSKNYLEQPNVIRAGIFNSIE